MRHEAAAIDGRRQRRCVAAGHFDERGQDVDQRDALRDAARGIAPRSADDQRHARATLEEIHLEPEAALAEHLAMVPSEHDDRVALQPGVAQRAQKPAEIVVDVGNRAVIGVARVADVLLADGFGVHRADMAQAQAMRIARRRARAGHVDVLVAIEVPIPCGNRKRVVRMGQGRDEQKRLRLVCPRRVVDRPLGREGDFVVEVDLVGAHAKPRLRDRGHVVVPTGALVRMVPVRRPAIVGGIDVRRQALLEAVQLVRTAKMHLA